MRRQGADSEVSKTTGTMHILVKPISKKERVRRHFGSAPWIACGIGAWDSVGW